MNQRILELNTYLSYIKIRHRRYGRTLASMICMAVAILNHQGHKNNCFQHFVCITKNEGKVTTDAKTDGSYKHTHMMFSSVLTVKKNAILEKIGKSDHFFQLTLHKLRKHY